MIRALWIAFGLVGITSCATFNYTEKCREQMNDCMRECAERSQSTPGTLPTCTTCKPEAERCDAQERLVESQAKP